MNRHSLEPGAEDLLAQAPVKHYAYDAVSTIEALIAGGKIGLQAACERVVFHSRADCRGRRLFIFVLRHRTRGVPFVMPTLFLLKLISLVRRGGCNCDLEDHEPRRL